jgi:hypothetical protein
VDSVAQRNVETRLRISRDLFQAVKCSPEKGYVIAERAGIHHAVLSRILHGVERLQPGDLRVLAVAREVGVPAERAFAS